MSSNDQIIKTLHQNASSFFDKVINKNESVMSCKKGCSACCRVDLSVFEVEGDLIRNWFSSLNKSEQKNLLQMWDQASKEHFCQFLKNDMCTIYEVRPTICRTQGLPLFIESENLLDYCPLNFEERAPEKGDWLNLERLNTMLSLAATSMKRDGRVRLADLQLELRRMASQE